MKSAAAALASLFLFAVLPAALALALSACNRGSEIENEVGVGTIYRADGTPAADADVRVYAVDHLPSGAPLPKGVRSPDAVFTTVTDARGRYRLDTLAKGEYNIAASLDGEFSFEDSIFVSGPSTPLPSDTLGDPATFTGIVGMQPNHNPQTALVQVLGTSNYVNVGRDGRFTLAGLGAGKYTARVSTTERNYTPLIVHFSVEAGEAAKAADTLRLIFTGIPIVQGLSASYDTAAGVVTLSWRKSAFQNLLEYVVLREDAESVLSNVAVIGRTRDTVFRDSLDDLLYGRRYLYQVLLRDRSRAEGAPYETQEVHAVHPNFARTSLTLRQEGSRQGLASIGDSVRVIARFQNFTREIRKVTWHLDGAPIRTRDLSLLEGADTVNVSDPKAHRVAVAIEVEDISGTAWKDSTEIGFEQDPPWADAGKDTILSGGSEYALMGRAEDGFGSIVKWEWDLGLTGTFSATATGHTMVTIPAKPNTILRCVLRVTDDDGNQALDTVALATIPYSRKAARPKLPGSAGMVQGAVSVGGKIFMAENRDQGSPPVSILEYNPATDAWTLRAESFRNGEMFQLGDKIYTIGTNFLESFDPMTYALMPRQPYSASKSLYASTPKVRIGAAQNRLMVVSGVESSYPSASLVIYDPLTDSWRDGKPVPYALLQYKENFATSFHLDRLLILPQQGNPHNYRYDTNKDEWLEMKRIEYGDIPDPIGAVGPKLYFQNHNTRTIDVYDTEKDEWSRSPRTELVGLEGSRTQVRFHVQGHIAYALRQVEFTKTIDVRRMNLASSAPAWESLVPIRSPHEIFSSFLIDGKIYVLAKPVTRYAGDPVLFEYQPE